MFTNSVISNEPSYLKILSALLQFTNFLPTKNKSRSFQYTWIKQYSWLSYSQSLKWWILHKLLSCQNHSLLAQLFTQPKTCFIQAKTTLQEHKLQITHKMAMDDSMASMGQKECGHLSIQQLKKQASITIQKNRAILKYVLKAIIFCGKQKIYHRGSCEAISPVSFSQFAINPGNFQALHQFRIESGDKVLKDHFSDG